jgi:hypothetical protein
MSYIQVSNLGRVTNVDNQKDMAKAMGCPEIIGRPIIMTDESGELIGYGRGSEALYKSMPIIAAIKEMPLLKAKVVTRKEKPLLKAMRPKNRVLGDYSYELAMLDSVGK